MSDVECLVMRDEIEINGKPYKGCTLKMVEIHGGKDPEWKGWHNLILITGPEPGDQKALAGPIDPITSEELMVSIKCASEA